MQRQLIIIFLLAFLSTFHSTIAQQSQNITLYGQLDPEPIHYAGSWVYVDSSGNEYALVGTFTGTSIISIDDSNNIYEVDFILGPSNNWREMTVIDDYAYVVSEGIDTLEGMQVIYLGDLPDSAILVTVYNTTFGRAHMIQKNIGEDSAYVYVSGSQLPNRGTHILDVSNPAAPVDIGGYHPYYVHDCHVRGDRLYAHAIYQGTVDVVDISSKTNPQLLAQIVHPTAFPHSSWTSDDHKFLICTDEVDSLPARIWNIENLSNIVEVAQYTANYQSLVHNAYVRGDFCFITHNTEGLRVLDIAKPDVPVEVGYYDTWSGPSGGGNGLWSACPFLPSELIIGANRHDGLYVFRFNNTRAGRIYGEVLDSITGNPIVGALIEITQTGSSVLSNTLGEYKMGELPDSGAGYTLQASALGYFSKSVSGISLNGGDSLWYRFELVSTASSVNGRIDETQILLYPNPATDLIYLKFPSEIKHAFEARIFDLQGRMLRSIDISRGNLNPIPLSGISPGTYNLIILNKKGEILGQKEIVKIQP